MKRGPLTKDEKQYIKDNVSSGAEQLALDLDRSEDVIKKNMPSVPVKKELTPLNKLARDSFARVKAKKSGKVIATVLTAGAAQIADDTMRKGKKDESHIHRPLGDNNE
jgi:hypothetical protein